LSGQLLLATSSGSPETLRQLVEESKLKGKNNVAFVSMFMLKDIDGCIDLLIETKRIPEAAFMARTYAPSRVSEIIALWKEDLSKVNKKAAEALADPTGHLELFEGFDEALAAEKTARVHAGTQADACEYGVGLAVDKLTDAIDDIDVSEQQDQSEGAVELEVEKEKSPEPEVEKEKSPEPEVALEPESEVVEQSEPEVKAEAEVAEEASPEPEVASEEPATEGVEEDWGLDDEASPAKAD
jgi:coatomer subunit beta'